MKAFRKTAGKGFTIVELLTVISVIGVLLGLLVPALNEVKKLARDIQQQAQFHSISVALDIFANEMDNYPESSVMANDEITGAHTLAEALVGRDLQGFDPMSNYDPDDGDYAIANDDNSEYATGTSEEVSLNRRIGPYLNMDKGGAFDLYRVYDGAPDYCAGGLEAYYDSSASADYEGDRPAPVITDVYRHVKRQIPTSSGNKVSVKIGAPVLYFKANKASKLFYSGSNAKFSDSGTPNFRDYVYNFEDNRAIMDMVPLTDETRTPPYSWADGDCLTDFYDAIANPQVITIDRPYNQDSYILLSAGDDGVYGTSDDIWNFGS